MRLSTLEKVIDIASRVTYVVKTKKTSLDRAFQEVVKGSSRRIYERVPHGLTYRLCKCVLRDYYKLLAVARCALRRSNLSMRFLVKLWIAMNGETLIDDELVAKIRQRIGFDESRVREFLSSLDPYERLAVMYSYPRWFVHSVCRYMPLNECEKLLQGLNRDDIFWVRVNTLKSDIDRVVKKLSEAGIDAVVDKDLPYMLRLVNVYGMPPQLEELVKNCEVVMQDKASAMVVEELDPEPGDCILDLAAAPGVKASLVMQLTENRARMVLIDVSRERVARMKKFLKCMGVDMDRVEVVIADSTRAGFSKRFDKALVDAPCTSSGVIPRDPAVKIHLESEHTLKRYVGIQKAMLRRSIELAEEVVYATCSVLIEEGEGVVNEFRANVVKPRIGAGGSYIDEMSDLVRRFYPHTDDTHGFFVSRMRGLRN